MMSKVATFMAFLGALAAAGGAALFFRQQAQLSGSSVWPLPGLVLLLWAGLGMLGFLGAFFSTRSTSSFGRIALPLSTGALLPLVILGAFSIGATVFISMLFLLAATTLVIIQKKLRWLDGLNFGMLGVIISLGLMLIFIALGR
jgi:Na+-transporting NADH:ubiquinone oxidoreductase subunit NqrB